MRLGNSRTGTPSNVEYNSKSIIDKSNLFCNNIRNLVLNQGHYKWFEAGEKKFANSTAGDGKN
jgi:hypothetical protein